MNKPISERILTQLKAELEAETEFGSVYIWDGRGRDQITHTDVAIVPGIETVLEHIDGNPGYVTKRLPVTIAVLLIPDESASTASGILRQRYQALAQKAALSNQFLIEDVTLKRLALWLDVVDVEAPELVSGLAVAPVGCQIDYRHDADDPCEYGTIVPAVAVAE